jgi:hypothetical protein
MRRIFYALSLICLFVVPVFGMDTPQKVQPSQESVSQDACPICLEPVISGQSVSRCGNKHAIHNSCAIDQMAATIIEGKDSTCPLCRGECEEQWVGSLIKPQLTDLLQKLKKKNKEINKELIDTREQNRLLQLEPNMPQNFHGIIAAMVQVERLNREVDIFFAVEVLRHTKKRMELNTWHTKMQAELDSKRSTWRLFSYLAVGINYISPFWTGFLVKDEPDNLKEKLRSVMFWGTMRNILTQTPIYMAGSAYLDFQKYKLNMQEIEKRITLTRDLRFESDVLKLSRFKMNYKNKVVVNQIKVPLLAAGAFALVPVIAETMNYLKGEPVDVRSMMQLSIGAGLAGGYAYQMWGSKNNQEWFEENKPKFGTVLISTYTLESGIPVSREHLFDPDMPQ